MKGITAWILRSKFCAARENNAFTGFDEVTVIGTSTDGGKTVTPLPSGVSEPTVKSPAVVLIVREMMGERVIHAAPAETPERFKGCVGPMAGGSFIESSDSRFREATGFYGAVSLHDLFETPMTYRKNST